MPKLRIWGVSHLPCKYTDRKLDSWGRFWTLGFLKAGPTPTAVSLQHRLCFWGHSTMLSEASWHLRCEPVILMGVGLTGQEPSIWRIRWPLRSLSTLWAMALWLLASALEGWATCRVQRLQPQMRLCVGPHSLPSSLTLWSSVVLSSDSWSVGSISPDSWSWQTEVKWPGHSRCRDQLKGHQPLLFLFPGSQSPALSAYPSQCDGRERVWESDGLRFKSQSGCRLQNRDKGPQLFEPTCPILQNGNCNGTYHLGSRGWNAIHHLKYLAHGKFREMLVNSYLKQ